MRSSRNKSAVSCPRQAHDVPDEAGVLLDLVATMSTGSLLGTARVRVWQFQSLGENPPLAASSPEAWRIQREVGAARDSGTYE